MSGMGMLVGDGSAAADSLPIVEIDRDAEPYRYACPNGHVQWDPTNSHIWCQSCRRQAENGEDVDPEHWEIIDKKTGETIPWDAVRVIE